MSIETQPGVGPLYLEEDSTKSAGLVPSSPEAYQTPLLDITQPVLGIEIVPAKPGFVATTTLNPQWIIESVVGAQTSPPHCQAGSDSSHSNMIAPNTANPTNANVNSGSAPPFIGGSMVSTALAAYIPNAPVFFDLTVGAVGTGGYKCMARLFVLVVWTAVGG